MKDKFLQCTRLQVKSQGFPPCYVNREEHQYGSFYTVNNTTAIIAEIFVFPRSYLLWFLLCVLICLIKLHLVFPESFLSLLVVDIY